MAIVEKQVRPVRAGKSADKYPRMVCEWWKFWNPRSELQNAIAGLDRVLVVGRVSQHGSVAFLPARMVHSEQLIVFPLHTYAAFCALQSRPHEIWTRFFGSSLEDRLRYTPTDCFETFPFPANWQTHPALEAAGKTYYDFRAALIIENDEGLTKTYNRFHDPNERDPEIVKLRALHAAMDRAVLDAYDWGGILTDCEFLLDYEIEEEEGGSRRKKPWRYRWPDEVRDEVLARLLDLNAERAKEEVRSGAASVKKGGRKRAAKRAPQQLETKDLFS